MRKFIAIALFAGLFVNTASAIELATSEQNPGFNLIYDPSDGSLTAKANSELATTVEIVSAGDMFRGAKADFASTFSGLFDVYNAGKAFKLDPAGFGGGDGLAFGKLDAGLTGSAILADMTVNGAKTGGGKLSEVTGGLFLVAIPEPSSFALLGLGVLGMLKLRRRK